MTLVLFFLVYCNPFNVLIVLGFPRPLSRKPFLKQLGKVTEKFITTEIFNLV